MFVRALAICTPLALFISLPARAASECKVTIVHFGDGATRRAALTTTAVLSVGDVSPLALDWLDFVRNEGPHDVRITLDREPPRQLARGETAPSSGRFRTRTTLSRIECLPQRSAALPEVPAPRLHPYGFAPRLVANTCEVGAGLRINGSRSLDNSPHTRGTT